MKKWTPTLLAIIVLATGAVAGSIKVWNTSDFLSANDLNANFAHIHGLMVGGHGPRLVNADVSAAANIDLSKINVGNLLPRSQGIISGSWGSISAPSGIAFTWISYGGWIASGVSGGSGSYTFSTASARTAGKWFIVATPLATANSNNYKVNCLGYPTPSYTTTRFTVDCKDATTGTGVDVPIFVQIYDTNP